MDSVEHVFTLRLGWDACIHSSVASWRFSTEWMQSLGQLATATSRSSSASPHCVWTLATFRSGRISNVRGAAIAHRRHPTQRPSSTKSARGRSGRAFSLRGTPVKASRPNRESAPNSARPASYMERREGSLSVSHARFRS